MKRTALLFSLLVLVFVELLLLESLFPRRWRHPISEELTRILPGQRYEPHPNMDLEIDEVLNEHRSLKIGVYLFAGALAVGNVFLILRLSKALVIRKRGAGTS